MDSCNEPPPFETLSTETRQEALQSICEFLDALQSIVEFKQHQPLIQYAQELGAHSQTAFQKALFGFYLFCKKKRKHLRNRDITFLATEATRISFERNDQVRFIPLYLFYRQGTVQQRQAILCHLINIYNAFAFDSDLISAPRFVEESVAQEAIADSVREQVIRRLGDRANTHEGQLIADLISETEKDIGDSESISDAIQKLARGETLGRMANMFEQTVQQGGAMNLIGTLVSMLPSDVMSEVQGNDGGEMFGLLQMFSQITTSSSSDMSSAAPPLANGVRSTRVTRIEEVHDDDEKE
jgi:hypothetical protein